MFSPRSILITGASSGLGRALAVSYVGEGVTLCLTGRNEERLLETVREVERGGNQVFWKALDVCDAVALQNWVEELERHTPLDLVISNAGITGSHEVDGAVETAETAHAQIATNLGGAVNVLTAVAPYMQRRKSGRIALISSLAGMQPISDGPAYGASKAGVIAYGEAMRDHLYRWGVSVSVICPGYILTPMADQFKSWRPYEYTAEQAAASIKKAIARKKAFHAFPWQLALSIRVGKLLPWKLRRLANQRFNYQR
ncbi:MULTISPECIES: SDR family oxidoreductase [unclassified Pseudovibrio]|uniref:SDR family NAD(P)-dependent oxidoreductase n=1 Tax=unclassified Pseudovibrio TaxID=2627060 RepID=UPI0007AEA4BB|nr:MULTISPECIES: SDR family NAD(P)-dependent oxidoreductase [unclassified Pseudovibrio]KZL24061.1 putative ketoacyl reductase [Pseudovibrio sp. Ad37]KZL28974.1 putative ketoacyl reductase [Pseudovibrio sp. WM33]